MRRRWLAALSIVVVVRSWLGAPVALAQSREIPSDPLAPVPGGITSEHVGARAGIASYEVEAANQVADGAAARTAQARARFAPQVSALARYSRLSSFTPEPLLAVPERIVGTQAAAGTPNPTPTQALEVPPVVVPTLVDQYVLRASIVIPVTDYFLRIGEGYSAQTHAEEASRWDLVAARAKAVADAKIAYYAWVRARGAHVVALQALAVAKTHLHDAEVIFGTGGASRADVLRARTAVSASELSVERARNGAAIAERRVRFAIHALASERLEPGESLDRPLSPPPALAGLVALARMRRPEIKSIDSNAEAARRLARVARAGCYPALAGFGDVTVANPNERRFPPRAEWFPTWALGAQVTWSPTEILSATAASGEFEARAASLDAQSKAARDGVELEVMQAHSGVNEADAAVATSTRELESALEGYRAARELFAAGRGTSTALSDSETALTQARFENLDARVDSRVSRVRLEHAVARDVGAP